MALTPLIRTSNILTFGNSPLVTTPQTITADHYGVFQAVIPHTSVDHQVFLAIVSSKLVFMEIVSDQALTIYTNAIHSGSPADIIPVLANTPIQWYGSGNSPVHTATVTTAYVSVPGADDATLTIAWASNLNS